jgi:hypothetical protein
MSGGGNATGGIQWPTNDTMADSPRAALLLTGHLRGSCSTMTAQATLAQQAVLCRLAFGARSCDVFLHTWDRLEKAEEYGRIFKFRKCMSACAIQREQAATSSWPCLANLTQMISPAGLAVETQDRARGDPADARMWNRAETLKSFRMQAASMLGSVRLAKAHAASMGHTDDVAVRMRADMGGMKKGEFISKFLTAEGWLSVRHATEASIRAAARGRRSCMVRQCEQGDKTRLKRGDFCFWSAPPEPLFMTLERVVGVELAGIEEHEERCKQWLNRSTVGAANFPVLSENVLLCAMYGVGVSMPAFKWGSTRLASGYVQSSAPGGTCG